ncbi:MAG: hypothetical protein HUU46_07635 [Candidatus Hydrogenedentes bacterium]|nr:hypothetical protein [Candidatus Hydrogenedentota bacterium]
MEFLTRVWATYPWAVDFCLYAFLFGAAARVSFAKIYPGHEGKTLAVSVGVVLAAGLTIAQRRIGFSLESLGPIAAVLLCLVVFIVAYRLLKHSDLPPWVTISFSVFFAIGLLRIALPAYTARLVRENPGAVFLVLAAVAFWMWQSASAGVEHFRRKLPGYALERFQLAPGERVLSQERQVAKKRLRHETKEDIHEEKKVRSTLSEATQLLEREGLTPSSMPRLQQLLDKALASSARMEQHSARVRQVDEALQRFDWKWFQRMRNVSLGQLTPAQQDILRRNILEERRRLNVEQEMKKLETEAGHRLRALEGHVNNARASIRASNAAAALGWLNEAQKEEQHIRELEEQLLGWEKRLLQLVSRQRKELLAA